ncbi:MAG: hypothetical protein FJ086_18955 [Deltaproteobacteria bacterium]|nr:hypothetical protein [Deltaproteobacteria bacterium]
MTPRAAALLLALAAAAPAWAEAPANPELVSIRGDYELGRFEQALARARERLGQPGLPEPEQLELNQLAGLSAFNLGLQADAERHLAAVLRMDPDHALDPFQVPPPAIQLFERLRKDLAPTLDTLRYEKKLRTERLQREAEAQAAAEAEAARKEAEARATAAARRALDGRNFLVNFVPFGAGQFQQGRNRAGVSFAAAEVALGAASAFGYWRYASLLTTRTVTLDNRQVPGERFTVTERGIPVDRASEADTWRWLQLGAGAAFYAAWAAGTVDAVLHHGEAPPPVSVHLLPLSGGAAAGLTARF